MPSDVSGRDVRKALVRAGFRFQRQKGSHMILKRDSPHSRVVVPDHKRIRPGTMRQILQEAGLTLEQFMELL